MLLLSLLVFVLVALFLGGGDDVVAGCITVVDGVASAGVGVVGSVVVVCDVDVVVVGGVVCVVVVVVHCDAVVVIVECGVL